MTDLSELIERVRAVTGPDRGIDRAIAKHFKLGWDYGADWPTIIDDDGKKTSEPTAYPYTASIDAITALIEKKLPGWQYGIDHRRITNGGPTAWLAPNENASRISAATPALALCLAFLLALHSQEQNSDQ